MASKRTIITLSEEDKQWLESYSRAHQVSLAEAIRQGIRRLKDAELEKTYRTIVQNTRGIWKEGDGLKYQRKLRSEWDSS
jgi:6-phosphogluconate dehydrogenase